MMADCQGRVPPPADPREAIGTVGRKCECLLHCHGDVLPSGGARRPCRPHV